MFVIVLSVATAVGGYTGILVSQTIADVITAFLAGLLFLKQIYPEIRG